MPHPPPGSRAGSGRSLHSLGSSFSSRKSAAAPHGAPDDASVDDATDDGTASEILDAEAIKRRAAAEGRRAALAKERAGR